MSIMANFNSSDQVSILEIARLGIAMVGDEIADEMDISDEELVRLRDKIQKVMEDNS